MTSDIRIGLWGAPGSGKTTFIGALEVAASNTAGNGNWKIVATGVSAAYLRDLRNDLVVQRTFPDATHQKTVPLRWQFTGELPRGRRRRKLIHFELEIIDPPGTLFGSTGLDATLIDYLAKCDGLVFLFDPTTEGAGGAQRNANFDHFSFALQEIAGRVAVDRTGFLPHHLAVCITKLDDPAFFNEARNEGWISQDRDGARLPRVPDDTTASFFEWICSRSPGSTASVLARGIELHFRPDRVRYFAVSSIGFRTSTEGVFDIDDHLLLNSRHGRTEFIQMPRPVNVLEPLIWLESKISGSRP